MDDCRVLSDLPFTKKDLHMLSGVNRTSLSMRPPPKKPNMTIFDKNSISWLLHSRSFCKSLNIEFFYLMQLL